MNDDYFGSLEDFKSWAPKKMTIEGNKIKVETVLDFPSIKEAFAFCVTAEKAGYTVFFEREDVLMSKDGDDNIQSLKLVMAFYEKMAKEG